MTGIIVGILLAVAAYIGYTIYTDKQIPPPPAKSQEDDTAIQDLTVALRNDKARRKFSTAIIEINKDKEKKKEKETVVSEPIPMEEAPKENIHLKIETIEAPQMVEQGQKMQEISFIVNNHGKDPVDVDSARLCFVLDGEDVSHEYTVHYHVTNPKEIPEEKGAIFKFSVDIDHRACVGQVAILPKVHIQGKDLASTTVPIAATGGWQVEPTGRILMISFENAGSQVAGVPFSIKISAHLLGRLDNNYQGKRKIYFTTTCGGTTEYPSQIPKSLEFEFKNGAAQSEKEFCFYNTMEHPTITAIDKDSGGGRGTSGAIDIEPGITENFQISIDTPQTNKSSMHGQCTVIALDTYGNVKTDYDDDVVLNCAPECQIIMGSTGNLIKGSSFVQGKVDLVSLGLTLNLESLTEPQLITISATGDGKTSHSNEVLLLPPSDVTSDDPNKTSRTTFRRLLGYRKKRIWIANCEPDIVSMLQENFEQDYEVQSLTLEEDKIDSLLEEKPDILFLDAGSPSQDGFAIVRQIKKRPETECLPILFLGSPYEDEEKILKVLRSGCAYVTKPLTVPAVKARVVELLEAAAITYGKLPVRGARLQGSDGLLYQIIAKLGEGGMGHIYEAERLRDHKHVIIKYLPPSEFRNIKAIMRFIQEALTVIHFEHENLVQGYDLLMDRNRCFYIMELIEGKTLEAVIHEGRVDPIRATQITLQVARALEALCEVHHVVHRDIKPANILVTDDNLVKLVDFGIAKVTDRHCSMTTRGIILGTPYYLSPEQILGKEVTIQSDIYSLGATYYHMVVGEVPFEGRDVLDIIHQRLSRDPKSPKDVHPNIPTTISNTIMKMMDRKANRRYESAGKLIEVLEQILEYARSGRVDLLDDQSQLLEVSDD